ncbi:MAG: NAD-dependent DNA ligase LigA [Chitinophagaceae bacterium]
MNTYSQEEILSLSQSYISKPKNTLSIEAIETLKAVVSYHNRLYYKKNKPLISDYEYDLLYQLLKQEEAKYSLSDSVSEQVGNSILAKSRVYAHITPMLSLENSYNEADLMDFHHRITSFLQTPDISYNVEPKLDGVGVSLFYKNNVLQKALTRGDGQKGEDITTHLQTISSLPLEVHFSKYGFQEVEIRGEIVLKKKDFENFNTHILAEGGIPLANPRNAVAGTLRLKNMHEVRQRKLSLFLYHISYYMNSCEQKIISQYDSVKMLADMGFPTMIPQHLEKRFSSISEVITYCKKMETKKDTLPYEIDGMVIKLDDVSSQTLIGSTAHHPRWAIAFKFKPHQMVSTLKEVEFQVGRTGIITPVGKIQPMALGGVIIKSISLFNEDNIQEKDLQIGDQVLVERAGDVIPYISQNLPKYRKGSERSIIFPKTCPSCNENLVKMEAIDVAWRCINYHCPAQSIQRIIHFSSKNAMDIQGLGEKLIQRLLENGFLQKISDIYTLSWEGLKTWEGLGEKSIEKLKIEIQKSKTQPIHRLIFALGIRFVGEGTSKTLARHIRHIMDLKDISNEELQSLDDIGKKVSLSITSYFKDHRNRELLDILQEEGLNFAHTAALPTTENNTSVYQKTFLFTGTLTHLSRKEAENRVEERGGKILGNVSSNLHYLVVGENPGSKLQKAQKIEHIQLLSENQFLEIIAQK